MTKYRDKLMEKEREELTKLGKEELLRGEKGRRTLEYLRDQRKVSENILDEFNVGYCPSDVKHQFCGRIITPIYDTENSLIALSTRHIEKDHPQRFLHESFDKGSYLYGLHLAKKDVQKKNKVILVEGEIDVLVLHSYGFRMAVGILGSSLTLFQIALLSRYCSEIYLLFDGDEAGKKSIEKSMNFYDKEVLKNYGLRFVPVYLPLGNDPDDFVIKNGYQAMKDMLIRSREECLCQKGKSA